jgi:hypothetical protein
VKAVRAKRYAIGVAVIALAGCGGGGSSSSGPLSKSEYEHKMQSEAERLTKALQGADITSAKNMQEFASRLGAVKDDIAKAADDVDALDPPANAAADTQTIADVLHRLAAAIGQIQTAAAKNDGAGFQQAVRQLQAELRAAQPAVRDLKRKGYDVGEFAS